MDSKIPVLAIPVLNRGDLLLRCISSIDYPIGKLVIVNNGKDVGVKAVIDQVMDENALRCGMICYDMDRNLGVAGSWNLVIDRCPADWWLFVGNDIRFTPGDLKAIDEGVVRHPEMVLRPCNHGHSLFAIRPSCIEQVGYFDENFWPAYCEDQDQMRRISLAKALWADVGKAEDEIGDHAVRAVHGEAPTWGSHTIYADPDLFALNQETQVRNFEYYKSKWGGPPGEEIWQHPYNDVTLSLKDWILPVVTR